MSQLVKKNPKNHILLWKNTIAKWIYKYMQNRPVNREIINYMEYN